MSPAVAPEITDYDVYRKMELFLKLSGYAGEASGLTPGTAEIRRLLVQGGHGH